MLMPAIERYLTLRRALGYTLETSAGLLRSFARFAAARGDQHIVAQTAIDWATQSSTPAQRRRRLKVIITLAQFLHAEDARHAIPPDDLFCPPRPRPSPYIFTPAEIDSLLQAAAQLGPPGSLRPDTYRTLFGLLAVCGLRVSEALALRLEDLTGDGFNIRETKFHKSRWVALHPSSAAALARYLTHRLRVGGDSDTLFISLRGRPLRYDGVYRIFRQLCTTAGLPERPKRPRLHDLRHSVAVRMLQAAPHSRDQVTPHMLALSTYLGHASVRSTYWYLESTPQLMHDIARAGETWLTGDQP